MSAGEKRIGYVDWELENYHANVYLKILRGELAGRGYTVAGCTAMRKLTGRVWAEKNGVPWFDTVAALNEHVDFFLVLAPGKPEKHLPLCEMTFPCGKTTYVDKTFAPDLATAKKIFALADKHKVKIETSSALRFTAAQAFVREVGRGQVKQMVTWGGGRSFGEYAIHPTELVVSCMGAQAESLMRRGRGPLSQLLVNFSGGRTAVINVCVKTKTGFAASVTTKAETRYFPVDGSRLFVDAASGFLNMFDSGKPSIPRAESLMVRRILDAALDPRALKGFVKLK